MKSRKRPAVDAEGQSWFRFAVRRERKPVIKPPPAKLKAKPR